ncbi:chloride channel protein [Halobacterium noricense]|uniref:chloride channel protein n=1 Tax=Halobacterium noricense TaxID=223182 RepID=UPI001E390EAC|nr:chloride channel protein [Halobacterium noricense]UHH24823.1 chloride channel protein [Halobacterium noricense]
MDQRRFSKLLACAAVLGVTVGLVATGFRVAWLAAKHALWHTFEATYWRIPVSVAAGVLIGTILYKTYYPGALAALVRQFHDEGSVPLAENVPTVPVGFIGLIAGQNAGPEGVMSVVGGSFGTQAAETFGMPNAEKLLTLAGMGAGFGAILGAPIGGALLWLELPHERGLEYYEAIIPTFVASFAGYLTEAALGGFHLFPTWHVSAVAPISGGQLVAAAAVAVVTIPFGALYTTIFDTVGRLFNRWSPAIYVRTTVAGLGIGLLGYALPLTYFYGGSKMNQLVGTDLGLGVLVATLLGTMVAAAFTINGNWIGGLIVPHMFMGAVLGLAASMVVPALPPILSMLAGMAAFNAVVTGTPLSSALIAIALTDGASITPVFLAALVGFVGSPLVGFLQTAAPRREPPNFHVGD